ncbi:beta-galactosidase [Paenibacillus glycanilyticus]|uniref:Beta-galactosidase n=1 Tax=Paenibacillus glycanilyticus TaxID=126569 RepID=A0ABQ6G8P9_9BACL|nr:beta-galactosidase [Paenibacillus glycanilyticus]GLX66623.1 beta-galactosidase [Paenibacillus glycanilyticus]
MYTFKPFQQPTILENHLNLGGENPAGEKIDVTSLYFTRGGQPWIAVMGEFHFSRYDRKYWYEELCKMKAGGITLVSTYVFWIYHEEVESEFDFSGDNDLRAFILECKRAGLDVVIRIGPWAHGECRNGGYPDWLLKKPFKLRENNPEYLEKVRILYGKIAVQVQGLFYKDGGNIIAVQVENELTDDAEHLRTLKQMAIESGMIAPLYTVTGWNAAAGAKIPLDEVVPVFGGYCDAPWDNHLNPLPPSPHYFFTGMRNDTGIGADLLPQKFEQHDGWQLPYERYPFATCELGGGLQVTHHRRSIVSGMDIYAISLVKLGDGNNLVGYYMYHGGTNKIGKLSTFQESKATDYPNDYPILSYDFQTALSEYGEVREQYRLLNLLHLFIQDFDASFAPMIRVEADHIVKRDDAKSLRYAMRTDGNSGYVFVNHYQRLSKLEDIRDVVIDTGIVKFPSIDVVGDVSFFLPFNMDLSGHFLRYATAQPLCRQGDTYFFMEIPGIVAEYQFTDGQKVTPKAGIDSSFKINGAAVVTLTWEQAQYLRRLEGELYLGDGCDLYHADGSIHSVADGDFRYWCWNGEGFELKSIKQPYTEPAIVFEQAEQPPFDPKYTAELHIGGERAITWLKLTVNGSDGFVNIDYYGDGAQLYADGQLVADSFYYGEVWRVPARLLDGKQCYLAVSEIRDDFYREFESRDRLLETRK